MNGSVVPVLVLSFRLSKIKFLSQYFAKTCELNMRRFARSGGCP